VLLDTGMSFETAFWTIAAVELVAALGIVVLVFRLTGD
jgi:NADH:ubiquinone oxidoreductase subunit K